MTAPMDPFGGPEQTAILASAGKLKFMANFTEIDEIVSFLMGQEMTYPSLYPRSSFGGNSFEIQAQILAHDVDKLGVAIKSFKTPLKRVVEQVLIPSIQANFAAGGRPRWQPLAQGTIDNRKGSAEPVLVRTGRLRRVATQRNMWWYITVTSGEINGVMFDQRQLEKRAKYGVFQQYGSTLAERIGRSQAYHPLTSYQERNILYKRHNWELPARPFVQMIGTETTEAQIVFYHWLVERVDYHYYGWGRKPGRK
jgi:hypothetical protein